jgi:hypothetical protein
MQQQDLIHDWNAVNADIIHARTQPVELDDETLRDGLQCPSVTDPPIAAKIEILHLMCELGIDTADIGLPGAGPRAEADVRALAIEIANSKLPIAANCAARTIRADVEPIVRITQATGVPIEACTFIGSSPIRQYAEDWTLERMLKASEDAVRFAVGEGLSVMYVTEDSTRARPDTLKALYTLAIECGAKRICLADTVGHATPAGVRQLVRFIREEVIAPTVDHIIYAEQHAATGKPAAEPFRQTLSRLRMRAGRSVCIGDDPIKDIGGARALGIRTIRVARFVGAAFRRPEGQKDPAVPRRDADAVVESFNEVPLIAAALLDKAASHAA